VARDAATKEVQDHVLSVMKVEIDAFSHIPMKSFSSACLGPDGGQIATIR
jgi:hypothetical protein